MATKKPRNKEADERYNARRRAKRALARLEKQVQKQIGNAKKETIRYINQLRNAIKDSYIDKKSKQYKQTVTQFESKTLSGRQFERKIAEQNKRLSAAENRRRNEMVKSYFRSAAKTETQLRGDIGLTPEQKLIRATQAQFYKDTRVLWQGGSPELRNENIIAGLQQYGATLPNGKPVENLQDALDLMMQMNPDKYPTMDKILKGEWDTEEDDFADEVEEEAPSPPPVSRKAFRNMFRGK